MEKLTKEDIQLLLEAVDSWVERGLSGYIVGTTLVAMVSRGAPDGKKVIEEHKMEYERTKNESKERAIMLKAKLLSLKDKLDVESVI